MDAQSVHSQGRFFKFSRDLHCSLQNLEGDLIWHLCCEGEKQRNTEKCKPHVQKHEVHRGGSRIFFRRGCTRLLLYFNTNKPHSFFFCRIPVVLENCRSSRSEGGATPGASTITLWVVSHKMITWQKHFPRFVHIKMESVQSFFLGWLNNPTK